MKKDWFEVFRAGEHTDSSGKVRNWTEADLDNIVSKYDPAIHTAPIVIGHPKDNSPAWGWIKSLKRVGDKLLALPDQIVEDFEEWYDKGLYKKRSISLYEDGTLRHVGFLGAMPPAVKGLADFAFDKTSEAVTYEFSESWRINTIGRMFQNLREWMIEKFGKESADQVLDQYFIDDLKQYREDPTIAESVFNENNSLTNSEDDPMDTNLKKELDELKGKVSDFQNQLTQKDTEITNLKNENSTLKTQITASAQAQRKAEYEAFAESLIKDPKGPKILPSQKESIVQQLEAAYQSGAEISFSEGEGKEPVKISAVENLKKFFQTMPSVMSFEEFATSTNATAGEPPVDSAVKEGQSIADKINKKS